MMITSAMAAKRMRDVTIEEGCYVGECPHSGCSGKLHLVVRDGPASGVCRGGIFHSTEAALRVLFPPPGDDDQVFTTVARLRKAIRDAAAANITPHASTPRGKEIADLAVHHLITAKQPNAQETKELIVPSDGHVVIDYSQMEFRLASSRDAASEVMEERARQHERGFHAGHDDGHTSGQLIDAALLTIYPGLENGVVTPPWNDGRRPWEEPDLRRRLVVAAALLCAEVDRLDRSTGRPADEKEAQPEVTQPEVTQPEVTQTPCDCWYAKNPGETHPDDFHCDRCSDRGVIHHVD